MKKIMLCAFFLIMSNIAQASSFGRYSSSSSDSSVYRFGWSLMRYDHTTKYNGLPATDTQENHFSTKFGYTFSNGFYLGALYESATMFYQATGTPSPEVRVSYGPSLGYYNAGFFILGSYLSNTTDTLPNGSYYSGGSGLEVEVGYNYSVAANFYIGVSLIYNSYSWSQYTQSGVSSNQTNTQTDTYPALGLGFTF